MKCRNCVNLECNWCDMKADSPDPDMERYCHWFAQKTNADRIRAMTDEELDRFLGEIQWDVANYCGGVTQKQEYPVPEQRGAWLDWLKAEVSE